MSNFFALFEFLADIWRLITQTLLFQQEVFAATAEGQTRAALIGMAAIAAASLLLGQSTVLFINHVSSARLALTMLINSVVTVAGWALWAVLIWLVARYALRLTAPLPATIRLVTLASAPFVLGFLVLMPYFGTFIERLLHVWSFLLLLAALTVAFRATFVQACLCAGIGWAVLQIFNNTAGRLLIPLRERFWRLVTGRPYHYTSADDLVALFVNPTDDAPGPSAAARSQP